VQVWRESVGALRERPFRLLWLGRSTSSVGDAIAGVALAFAVLEVSGSASALGLVLATFTVARVAFTLVGGVWSDRLPRRLVLLVCDLVRGAIQAVVAALLIADAAELWHLTAGAALVGGASAFFGPASTGFVPETVSRERLQQANALLSASDSASWLFGPALSGALIAAFGTGVAFAIDAASFLVSAAFLLAIRVERRAEPAERQTFLADLARGWREVRARTWVQAALVTFSLSNVAIAVFFVLGPVVFADELGGAADWGVAMTVGAAGGLLGSAVALRYRPPFPLRPSFLVILPVSLAMLSLVPPSPPLVVGAACGAMFAGIHLGNALWDTVLQQHVPREVVSRVSSYDWLVSLVFMPLGYTLAGPLADTIGRDATLIGAAALSAAANLGVLLVPSVWNLPRLDAAAERDAGSEPASSAQPV
jgi:MFS family permease